MSKQRTFGSGVRHGQVAVLHAPYTVHSVCV